MQAEIAAQLAAAIETPRLWLEPIGEPHAEAFFQPLQQDEALYRWISCPKPTSLDALRRHWRELSQRQHRSPDGCLAWPVWALRRKSDGRYIGRVDAEITPALEASNLGYYVFSPFCGLGYASEAAGAATERLIARGVQRLVATVTVGNTASGRVLQKAGFKFARILPGNDVIRGVEMDDEEWLRVA
ncbi:RimJ/RimL family protein N-acetyltransferase [Paucibacter oligotrophus]|uniref:RimJ/RimL family protein N-acetyltransferase n=1 Tax=Roseateles oligotrophus TaxID=1769250 RepID=A0A840L2Y1_9BURK|nr:GNAT family N-acetyltransferase [Roseateles oligotrophus]MBB4842834.1 RimJ/RimL family protein N-acetyltransferase [Roseateles oligotrophus]